MARNFVRASSQRMAYTGGVAVPTDYPITLAGWFRDTTSTNGKTILAVADSAGGAGRKLLLLNGTTVNLYSENDAGGAVNINAGAFTAGVWTHGCAVFAASNDFRVFRDGANKATSSSTVAFGTPSAVQIGVDDTFDVNYMEGDVAHCAIWNVALDDSEVAALGKGISPLLIRPASLLEYWPLYGNDSTENGRFGRYPLTPTNGPTKASTSPKIYQLGPISYRSTGSLLIGAPIAWLAA